MGENVEIERLINSGSAQVHMRVEYTHKSIPEIAIAKKRLTNTKMTLSRYWSS